MYTLSANHDVKDMTATWKDGNPRADMDDANIYSPDAPYGLTRVYDPDPHNIRYYNLYNRNRAGRGSSILDKDIENRQRYEFNETEFREVLLQEGKKTLVKIGNCQCRSTWCPHCYKLYYVPKCKNYIQKFDLRRTRHVVLTVDRNKFSSPFEALITITDKKLLSAIIRRLKKGKKVKRGSTWAWLYKPVKIIRALAVLEFHKDGFPHWHLLIEVEQSGKWGMIGQDNILDAWKYGMMREEYFRDKKHWNRIAGYFADKGYFEKGKEYQSVLPECIIERLDRKVRRITYYRGEDKKNEAGKESNMTEYEAFRDVEKYFIKKVQERERKENGQTTQEKRKTNYKEILARCGTRTYVEAMFYQRVLKMIVPIDFKEMKEWLQPVYIDGKGYWSEIPHAAIGLLKRYADNVGYAEGDDYNVLDYESEIAEELIQI